MKCCYASYNYENPHIDFFKGNDVSKLAFATEEIYKCYIQNK